MNDTKKWWESKTIIGLAIMVLGLLIKQLKIPIAETEIAGIVAFICEGIGGIMVLIGRFKAQKKIG